jgi:FAD/FMN-containing dehydrogenase
MKNVKLDPAKRVADAEPGVQVAEFDNLTAPAGLAASLGVCPDVVSVALPWVAETAGSKAFMERHATT